MQADTTTYHGLCADEIFIDPELEKMVKDDIVEHLMTAAAKSRPRKTMVFNLYENHKGKILKWRYI